VHQVDNLANLQSRKGVLYAHNVQLELEQELTRSIARSRAQLVRLTGHGSVLLPKIFPTRMEGDVRASV
jgi:hypothetical protein